jgi:hypothetical protein
MQRAWQNKVPGLQNSPRQLWIRLQLGTHNVQLWSALSLDTDVEMTPVVALPEGELKEGQIYYLVNSKLITYDQAHLSTDQASSGSPLEVPSAQTIDQPQLLENVVDEFKSNLLLMIFLLFIINYNS